jgi:hypothetical protein
MNRSAFSPFNDRTAKNYGVIIYHKQTKEIVFDVNMALIPRVYSFTKKRSYLADIFSGDASPDLPEEALSDE